MQNVKQMPHVPGYAPETLALIEVLCKGKPGDIMTDDELTVVTGGKSTAPDGKAYTHLQSACRYALRHKKLLWSREARAGRIKCLYDPEKLKVGKRGIVGVRRKAGRELRKMQSIETDKLDNEEKKDAMEIIAQLGVVKLIARDDVRPKLVNHNGAIADPKKLLERLLVKSE